MRRTLAVLTGVLAALAVAVPANANLPNGKGLIDSGPLMCTGLGQVDVITPRPSQAATGFTTSGVHAVLFSITVVGTDPAGNPFTVSKTYGTRAGLTPTTCTQHFDDATGVGDVTAIVGVIPPG